MATVTGRYYAMDRDKRWERTKLAYDAIVDGKAEPRRPPARRPCAAAYERGETDEFIKPTLVGDEGRIRDGDSVIFFNFRPDRARQLTQALASEFRARPRRLRDHAARSPSTRRTGTTRWPSRRPGPT